MEVLHTCHDGKHVIHPTGEIVFETAHRLRNLIASLLQGDGFCYTLDLGEVTHVDSTGFGVILSLNALLQQQGRSFQIRNVSAQVMQKMKLTGLTDILLPSF